MNTNISLLIIELRNICMRNLLQWLNNTTLWFKKEIVVEVVQKIPHSPKSKMPDIVSSGILTFKPTRVKLEYSTRKAAFPL